MKWLFEVPIKYIKYKNISGISFTYGCTLVVHTAKVDQGKFNVMELHARPELAAQQRMVDDASGDIKVEQMKCFLHHQWIQIYIYIFMSFGLSAYIRCGALRTWSWLRWIPKHMDSSMVGTVTWYCTRTKELISSSTSSTCGRSVYNIFNCVSQHVIGC